MECLTCTGSGILADDDGWQYPCNECFGDGVINLSHENSSNKGQSGNENNDLHD